MFFFFVCVIILNPKVNKVLLETVLNLLWVYLRALEENLLNCPSGLLKSDSDSQFHLFIDNSWERGGVTGTPPCVPQKERRQRRNDHIWPARHSSYGHWRQTWFSYRARGRLGLSRVFVLNDVIARVKTRPSLPPSSALKRQHSEERVEGWRWLFGLD